MNLINFIIGLVFISHINGFLQVEKPKVQEKLSLTELYVVDLEVKEKSQAGLCDCSVGERRSQNECELSEVVIIKVKYQADSSVFARNEILNHTKLLIRNDLKSDLKVGENHNVVLTHTSSKDYLQLIRILPELQEKEYEFVSAGQLTSLIECKGRQQTFRKK
ncbi:hypothetical protein C8N40_105113 [Pontibacter mucosus]|uniref:Uncharacterized protein n=1 Tax=Pontibacter mucosus TaxID=1649266 RepID=A0A2T5YHQ3_9BACT|nr:hypothetical protein [Pontibacter mucosus]PTX18824.1 hypothetical protein C8N40_105113 [Pontibacter mucosus]